MMRFAVSIVGGLALFAGLTAIDLPVHAQDAWGDVKGTIVWGGSKAPERNPLDLKAHQDAPICQKTGKVLDEEWVVNSKNMGLKNTFVWLAPAAAGGALPVHPMLAKVDPPVVEVDQPACAFTPHAIALRDGQFLKVKNTSTIPHNYKYAGNPSVNPGGNFLLPPGGVSTIKDLKADRLPVTVECNIHPWMRGWMRVFDHPYYAVTGDDGTFEFKNAPAGNYKLMIWHGSGGWLGGKAGKNGQDINIKAGSNDVGSLKYPPPG